MNRFITPEGYVADLVDRMIYPGLYYPDGDGSSVFMLFANDREHRSRIWNEIRNAVDESGAHYTANRSQFQFRIIDQLVGKPYATLSCIDINRADIITPMRGMKIDDIFICASEEMIARKIDHEFNMSALATLYREGVQLQSTYLNSLRKGAFDMKSHIDTVHTNRQRLDKIRSVLHAADVITNQDGYDAISKQVAIDALREASKEALSSLNAIEQHISDEGDMDIK